MTPQPSKGRTVLSTASLPTPRFHYSSVVSGAGCIFVSGLVGLDSKSGQLSEGSYAQARQVLNNLLAVCDEHGMSMEQILHARVYCSAAADTTEVNRAWNDTFSEVLPPARTFVVVHSLPLSADVEMDFVLVDAKASNAD